MALKTLILLLFSFIAIALYASFDAAFWVWISFFFSFLVIGLMVLHHIFLDKEFSPFISGYIVFSFLFFQVAPIVQINSFTDTDNVFITKFPYSESLAIYANILITIFNITFFSGYLYFRQSKYFNKIPTLNTTQFSRQPAIIFILAIITTLVFFLSLGFIQNEYFRPSWMPSPYSIATLLLWKKVLFLLPFAGIILCVQYFKQPLKNHKNLLIIFGLLLFFILMLLWFKNPLTEKRNALGPIYITLLFFIFPRFFNKNVKMLLFLFLLMVVAFPLSAVFTHSDATFQQIIQNPLIFFEQNKGGSITDAFNTLNYDAFFNIMTTIEYIGEHGLSWGYQLLGGLLFFIPRSIWVSKPESTGKLIGEYLIEEYDYIFSNLSNSLVSEGFINFGVIGVIMMATLLAMAIVKLITWLKSNDFLKRALAFYFSMHLIFLLRGDFTNAFSYYIGLLIAVWLLPKFIGLIIKQLHKA